MVWGWGRGALDWFGGAERLRSHWPKENKKRKQKRNIFSQGLSAAETAVEQKEDRGNEDSAENDNTAGGGGGGASGRGVIQDSNRCPIFFGSDLDFGGGEANAKPNNELDQKEVGNASSPARSLLTCSFLPRANMALPQSEKKILLRTLEVQ